MLQGCKPNTSQEGADLHIMPYLDSTITMLLKDAAAQHCIVQVMAQGYGSVGGSLQDILRLL